MAKPTEETVTATEEALKISEALYPDKDPLERAALSFSLWKSISFVLRSSNGRARLGPTTINARRRAVKVHLDSGKSYAQIAKTLRISEDDVANDVRAINQRKTAKP